MDTNSLMLALSAIVICALYLMRRRARLQRDE
jgi:hypothetical protein